MVVQSPCLFSKRSFSATEDQIRFSMCKEMYFTGYDLNEKMNISGVKYPDSLLPNILSPCTNVSPFANEKTLLQTEENGIKTIY